MIDDRKNAGEFALTEAEMLELLDRIQEMEQARLGANRRKYVRHAYVRRDVRAKIVQPGGGATERIVAVRDLSTGGMNILYPGYLHTGSMAHLTLKKLSGRQEIVRGLITHCRHVSASWHSVGVKFSEPIYPRLFLIPSSKTDSEEIQTKKIDLTLLKGAVLLVDDQPMDRMLFTHLMQGSSVRVTEAATVEEASALITRSLDTESATKSVVPFNVVVIDPNLGTEHGESSITAIRQKGYTSPILVLTAETSQERQAAALAAGGTVVLQKPYTPERLYAALIPYVGEGGQMIEDPIFSALCIDPTQCPLVEKYVKQVQIMANDLRKTLVEADLAKIRRVCQSLKGTGTGYGFPLLTEAAAAATVSLDSTYSVVESTPELQRLEGICARLSPAAPPVVPKNSEMHE